MGDGEASVSGPWDSKGASPSKEEEEEEDSAAIVGDGEVSASGPSDSRGALPSSTLAGDDRAQQEEGEWRYAPQEGGIWRSGEWPQQRDGEFYSGSSWESLGSWDAWNTRDSWGKGSAWTDWRGGAEPQQWQRPEPQQ